MAGSFVAGEVSILSITIIIIIAISIDTHQVIMAIKRMSTWQGVLSQVFFLHHHNHHNHHHDHHHHHHQNFQMMAESFVAREVR